MRYRANGEGFMNIDKVIAVQNCGSSGTLLMQSLLDHHPQILSLPALHGQQLLIFWEKNYHLDKKKLLENFLINHQYWFEPEIRHDEYGLLQMGENQNERICIDKNKFTACLAKLWGEVGVLTRKYFITSVYIAYHQTLEQPIDSSAWLLYPIHSLPQPYALQLVSDFSQVFFLHMIREPIQNMGSTAKHINRYTHWKNLYLLSCTISQMFHDIAIHSGNCRVYGIHPYLADSKDHVQCRALRLEDLHNNLEYEMTKICRWLNISWRDSLLISSFDGKLWHNRRESVRQTGAGSKTMSQKHEDILTGFDQYRLHLIANFFSAAYQYQKQFNFYNKIYLFFILPLLFLPFKMELLFDRYRQQINDLNQNPLLRKDWGWFGKVIAYRFPSSKFVNQLTILFYTIGQYIEARRLLLGAWVKSLSSHNANFVKLLL